MTGRCSVARAEGDVICHLQATRSPGNWYTLHSRAKTENEPRSMC